MDFTIDNLEISHYNIFKILRNYTGFSQTVVTKFGKNRLGGYHNNLIFVLFYRDFCAIFHFTIDYFEIRHWNLFKNFGNDKGFAQALFVKFGRNRHDGYRIRSYLISKFLVQYWYLRNYPMEFIQQWKMGDIFSSHLNNWFTIYVLLKSMIFWIATRTCATLKLQGFIFVLLYSKH